MNRDLTLRLREIQKERNVGLLEAKRIVLLESAEVVGEHALSELELLLGRDAARHIDQLIKTRIVMGADRG